jgi:hypothetical protein
MTASWKIILATTVIFATGIVTGVFWSDLRNQQNMPDSRRENMPRGPRMHDFIQRFGERLELSETQRTHITQLLTESQERMDTIMKAMRPRIDEEFSTVNASIKSFLTEEQATQFEEIIKARRQRGPGGRGGPREGGLRRREDGIRPGERRPGEESMRPPRKREPQESQSSTALESLSAGDEIQSATQSIQGTEPTENAHAVELDPPQP